MHNPKHILISVDDSEASNRAVAYVGRMIGARQGFCVYLLHALSPTPRELLECGGTSNPQEEERQKANLRKAQRRWIDAAERAGPSRRNHMGRYGESARPRPRYP